MYVSEKIEHLEYSNHLFMTKILLFALLIFSNMTFSQTEKEVDVIYLTNGNILTGTVISFIPNDKLTLSISEGVSVDIVMSKISKMEKKTIETNGDAEVSTPATKTTNEDAITTKSVEEIEKKERPFLKALGNFGVAVLNEAANPTENSTTGEAGEEGEENTSSNSNTEPSGGICFVNPNFNDRNIVLVKQSNQKRYQILVGLGQYRNPQTTCSEVIEAGTYDMEVYTTFTKKKIEAYTIIITEGNIKNITLSENQYN